MTLECVPRDPRDIWCDNPLIPDEPFIREGIAGAIDRAAAGIRRTVRAFLADAARVAVAIVGTVALLAIGVVMIIAGVFSLLGVDPKTAAARGGPLGVAAQLVKG